MFNQELYQKSIDFAATAHKKQKVPGKEYSYIVHLSNVSMEIIVAIYNSNVNLPDLAVQCALLHDVLEDTDVKYENIVELFGKNVADGVKSLTKNNMLSKENRMIDSLNRIKKQPMEVGMVKLADRITNLQIPPSNWDNNKKEKYLNEAVIIYDILKNCNMFLSNRLLSKIKDYKKYIN